MTTAIGVTPVAEAVGALPPANNRPMLRADLLGSHSHSCTNGVTVHVWIREEKFLARGRHQGKRFGATLGKDKPRAEAALRRLLIDIEDGKFVRATERAPQFFEKSPVNSLTLRELCDRCLQQKRKLRGRDTAQDYQARLSHVLDHIEAPDAARRWPLARNIDLDYAIDLRSFLTRREVTRNGRSSGPKRPMSARQIRNALEVLRMVLDWAVRAGVRLLPVDFVNPITPEILGPLPVKDPLREVALPLPARVAMLARMDDWQFLNLAALLVLPLRHEDAARALISDVDLVKGELRLGDHFGGCDFAKGKVNVSMPLPPALIALFRVCVGERAEGPLFLSRRRRRGKKKAHRTALDAAAFRAAFDRELSKRPNQDIQAPLDRKRVYCEFLEQLGGVTADEVAKELRKLLPGDLSTHPYALRHGVTQDMHESGIPHLELRYLTAHSASDILNEYVRLNPKAEMQKYYERCQELLQPIEERVQRLTQSHALH